VCPDHQILSVYFDNELDSPWKEKLEVHLAGCAECRSRLEAYGQTRELLGVSSMVRAAVSPADAAMEAARARVWEKLEPLTEIRRGPSIVRGFWTGSFRVPVPVAAAAGLVLVLAFGLLLGTRPQKSVVMPQMAGVGMDIHASPVSADMESILKYLNTDNSAEMVIIRLPETTFRSEGEPKMIRAVDYTENNIRK
jgi:anti-sigma factor RsiW